MKYSTEFLNVTLSSHDIQTEDLKRLGVAVGVAMGMLLHTSHMPFMTVNAYDKLDGYNLTVSIGHTRAGGL